MKSSKYAYVPLKAHYGEKNENWLKSFLIHNKWEHKIDHQVSVSYIPFDQRLSNENNSRVFAYIISSSPLFEGNKFLDFLKKHYQLDNLFNSQLNYEDLFTYCINDFAYKENYVFENQVDKFFNVLSHIEEKIFNDVVFYLEGYYKHLLNNYGSEFSNIYKNNTINILSQKSDTDINLYKDLEYDDFIKIYFSGIEKKEILFNTSNNKEDQKISSCKKRI